MSQQPNLTDPTVTTAVSAPLAPVVERLNELMQEVCDMPRGGDLEGLIESHLAGLNQQWYDLCLARREQLAGVAQPRASAPAEAFPPAGLPAVPSTAAARSPQAAHDPDPAR